MDIEKTGKAIVNSAIKVHRTLGPGLLESVYQKCLKYELEKRGHAVKCELSLPVLYDEIQIDVGFWADMPSETRFFSCFTGALNRKRKNLCVLCALAVHFVSTGENR